MATDHPRAWRRHPETSRPRLEPRRRRRVRHFDFMLVGAAIALSLIGLVMIWSTTQAPHPGRRALLREAPGAVPARRHHRHGRGDRGRLPPSPRPLDGRVLRDRRSCCSPCSRRSARTSRVTRRGSSFPAASRSNRRSSRSSASSWRSPGYCNQYRGELDAWRITMILALAAVPIGLVLLQPDLGTVLVLGRHHRGLARGGRPHRPPAPRAGAARDHRGVRGRRASGC